MSFSDPPCKKYPRNGLGGNSNNRKNFSGEKRDFLSRILEILGSEILEMPPLSPIKYWKVLETIPNTQAW